MKLGDPSATKSALAGIGRAVTVGTIRPTALRDASMPLRPANNWPPAAAIPAPAATAADPRSRARRDTPAPSPAGSWLSRPIRCRTTNVPTLTINATNGASTSRAPAVGRVNTATLATTPSNDSSTNPRVCERRDSSPATTPISATRGAGPGLHPREILLPAVDENRRHPVAVLGSQLRVHIAGDPYNVHLGTDPAISLGVESGRWACPRSVETSP